MTEKGFYKLQFLNSLDHVYRAINIGPTPIHKEQVKEVQKLATEAVKILEDLVQGCKTIEEFMQLIEELGLKYKKEEVKEVISKNPSAVHQVLFNDLCQLAQSQIIPITDYKTIEDQPLAKMENTDGILQEQNATQV